MVTTVESSWLSFPAYLSPGSGPGLGQPQAPSPSPPPPAPPAPLAALDQINAVRNGTQQMNGMNLGGWLVIEQFLAPEMYANASTTVPWGPNPLTFGVYGERQLGIDAAQQDANDTTGLLNVTGRWRQAMFDHRATFVTEDDFALLASAGINIVRIPVGFWVFAKTAVRCQSFCSACRWTYPNAKMLIALPIRGPRCWSSDTAGTFIAPVDQVHIQIRSATCTRCVGSGPERSP
jgi:hypothetical protein